MARTIETVVIRRTSTPVLELDDSADDGLSWLDTDGLTAADALRALEFVEACRA